MYISKVDKAQHSLILEKIFSHKVDKILPFLLEDALYIDLPKESKIKKEMKLEKRIYFLAQGNAFLGYMNADGKKIISEMLHAGDIFGYTLHDGEFRYKRILYLEPLIYTHVSLYSLNVNHFKKSTEMSHEFSQIVLENARKRIIRLHQKVIELGLLPVEERLLNQIKEISSSEDKKFSAYPHIAIITHEKLADAIGTARETVSKTIKKMKKKGLIKQQRKNKEIKLIA